MNEPAKRLAQLLIAAAAKPCDATVLGELADLALSTGKWAEAAAPLERALAAGPLPAPLAARLILLWTALGRHETALEFVNRLSLGPRPAPELARAAQDSLESALVRGKPALVRQGYRTLARWAGDDSVAALRHAELELDAGDLDAGDAALARVLAAQPSHVLGRLLARRALGLKAARAIAELELLIARAPYDGRGIEYAHDGAKLRSAPSAAFTEALAFRDDVHENELHVALGRYRLERGEHDAGLRSLQRVRQPEPFLLADLAALKGRIWAAKGYPDLALAELSSVRPEDLAKGGHPEAIGLLADLMEGQGRPPEALRILRLLPKDASPELAGKRARLELAARTLVEDGAAAAGAPHVTTPKQAPVPDPAAGLPAGTVIQNVYEVMDQLGCGGMGVVLKVRNRKLDRIEALKLLPEGAARDPAAYERLVREAKLLASLSHPAIVRVHALGRHEGRPFLAMELLEGETLGAILRKADRMPLSEVSWIARAVAVGLHAAHTGGIVHRDVKPDNIMLMSGARAVKLMDFGLAHDLGSSSGVKRESFMGTIHYISPEQINGQDSGPAGDVYSFGVVLYEMLTGQTPFDSPNPHNLMFMHLTRPAPTVRTLRPDAPAALEALVAACLEKAPAKRPADFGAVLARLDTRP